MLIDFHIHSKYSFDCFSEPAMIVEYARRNKLDGFAITDHEVIAPIDEFNRLAPEMYIIAGQEITTKDGDIVGLFLKKRITEARKDSDSVINEIRSQGGLAVLAHPFKWPYLSRKSELLKKFDCLEVFNARNNIPMPYLQNFLCRRAVDRFNLNYIAGSDAHQANEVGTAATIFDFSKQDADDDKIKDAILNRRVKFIGSEMSLPREVVSHFYRNARSMLKK